MAYKKIHEDTGAMIPAVIYARYSSRGQLEEIIEKQLRDCYEYALKNGFTVEDKAVKYARYLSNVQEGA